MSIDRLQHGENGLDELLSMREVSKHFGGVTALDKVSFDLVRGEIHALLGENGAGKSTLIKILAGVHEPDAGQIRIEGRCVAIPNVAEADRLGIRVIHQELSLAPNLTVAENIYLGREPHRWGWLNRKSMFDRAEELIERLELQGIGPVHAVVSKLSVAQRQLVEIARALSCQARILILDEPTSSLSDTETQSLFATLHRLRQQGVGIVYISHRLDEILQIADRITVLRDGHSIGTQSAADVNRRQLVHWMVGREIVDMFHRPPESIRSPEEAPALEVRNLCNPSILNVSFRLHYGEILGIAGLVGAGRSELARALFGIDPIDTGQILIDGQEVLIRSPQDALHAGMVLVPEDRRKEGLVMIQSVAFNIALPWTADWHEFCMPNLKRRTAIVERAIASFRIKLSSPDQSMHGLSGGNQQKVLVSRWMEHRPKILILDEPARGVDVGAREDMFRIVGELVASSMAVLLISSELSEVLNVSHRVLVYRDGKILETIRAEEVTSVSVMERLTGANIG